MLLGQLLGGGREESKAPPGEGSGLSEQIKGWRGSEKVQCGHKGMLTLTNQHPVSVSLVAGHQGAKG